MRDEKAKILGYQNYAELSLEFKMAESPEQVIDLFSDIAQKAKVKAVREIEEIQEHFHLDTIQEWDLAYYLRILKEEKYAVDEKELKKYFEFSSVQKGMFEIVEKLYGIQMKVLSCTKKIYGSDIKVYEVYKDGIFLSYFMTDYFYNPLKRPGAWANILREKYSLHKKLVINVANFQKGVDDTTLMTLSDVETMFHEF